MILTLTLAAQALADDKVATQGPWKCERSWNNGGMPLSDFSIPGSNLGATVEMLSVDAYHIVNMRSREPIIAQALIDLDKLHQFAISQLEAADCEARSLKGEIQHLKWEVEELRAQSIESHRRQGIAERERDALKEECEGLRDALTITANSADRRLAKLKEMTAARDEACYIALQHIPDGDHWRDKKRLGELSDVGKIH